MDRFFTALFHPRHDLPTSLCIVKGLLSYFGLVFDDKIQNGSVYSVGGGYHPYTYNTSEHKAKTANRRVLYTALFHYLSFWKQKLQVAYKVNKWQKWQDNYYVFFLPFPCTETSHRDSQECWPIYSIYCTVHTLGGDDFGENLQKIISIKNILLVATFAFLHRTTKNSCWKFLFSFFECFPCVWDCVETIFLCQRV